MANPLDLPEGHRRTTAPAPPDTFPKLLRQHADVRGQQPAMREKDLGIWQSWNWKQVADEVQALACGLAAHGFGRGERLAVIGDNRPRLYWSLLAAQSLGGVPVPLYQDAVADEMVFVLADAGISVAVVEDQEQVDKLLEIRDRLPDLRLIVYDDPRGLRHYDAPGLMSCDTLLGEGRLFHEQHPLFYTGMVDASRGSDMAIMLYTSGTTGQPKGVVHTFDSMIRTARGGCRT